MCPALHAPLPAQLRTAGLLDLERYTSHVHGINGGTMSGPSPVDRGHPGSNHRMIVDAYGIPLASP